MTTTASLEADAVVWNFENLHGSNNFKIWYTKMMNGFQYEGWLHIFDEEDPYMPEGIPEEVADDVGGGTSTILRSLTKEEKKEYQRIMDMDVRHNQQAIPIMFNKMDDSIGQSIIGVEKAKKAMESLKLQYVDTSFAAKHAASQKLFHTTLSSCNYSVEDYIRNIYACKSESETAGCNLPEWLIVSCFISNLDGKFKDFVHRTVLLKEAPQFADVTSQLHAIDRFQKHENARRANLAQARKGVSTQESKNNKKRRDKNKDKYSF